MKQATRFMARAAAAMRDGDAKRANRLAHRAKIAHGKWDIRTSK